jgi:carbonic anhydrase/acetyltransferase-like protein (isoleucine patch superfamily)
MPEPTGALIAAYHGTLPRIAGPLAHAGAGAVILGRATLGTGAWLGHHVVIRADGHDVTIGDDAHLGAHATVHIAHDVYPTRIGDRVTAGPKAVIHACTIGDDCVIDREAVVLDGSTVGAGAMIAAGAIVFPRSTLEGGWLYDGSPARPVARMTAEDLARHRARVRADRPEPLPMPPGPGPALDAFLAPSARVRGKLSVGEGVGIWYGCILEAGHHRIEVGAGTNIQDNSLLLCDEGDIVIGPDVTIGHNVTMAECRVEANSLVGIGAIIAAGTVVESDVLVAAGAETEPGQRLTAGQVWGGRPARPIGPMDARKRAMLAATLPTYRAYADAFRAERHDPLEA